ncbi:hypothetical protein P171DRAFT_521135 [Karstenula rhodostoma CBS 690.94]|uniref:Uncharacterized protein n=1 Tax=Karstenula rhodostoma CBS 690.94 TaxID=1392251 RepID=A0A9P4PJ97_9PLEO|nr:hypothetical protein P171DRAFT_521135 [Karstenula rhodostoma CBS 690.94]
MAETKSKHGVLRHLNPSRFVPPKNFVDELVWKQMPFHAYTAVTSSSNRRVHDYCHHCGAPFEEHNSMIRKWIDCDGVCRICGDEDGPHPGQLCSWLYVSLNSLKRHLNISKNWPPDHLRIRPSAAQCEELVRLGYKEFTGFPSSDLQSPFNDRLTGRLRNSISRMPFAGLTVGVALTWPDDPNHEKRPPRGVSHISPIQDVQGSSHRHVREDNGSRHDNDSRYDDNSVMDYQYDAGPQNQNDDFQRESSINDEQNDKRSSKEDENQERGRSRSTQRRSSFLDRVTKYDKPLYPAHVRHQSNGPSNTDRYNRSRSPRPLSRIDDRIDRSRSPRPYSRIDNRFDCLRSPRRHSRIDDRFDRLRSPRPYSRIYDRIDRSRIPRPYSQIDDRFDRSRSPRPYSRIDNRFDCLRSPRRYSRIDDRINRSRSPRRHSRREDRHYRLRSPRRHSRRDDKHNRSRSPRRHSRRDDKYDRSRSPRRHSRRDDGHYHSRSPRRHSRRDGRDNKLGKEKEKLQKNLSEVEREGNQLKKEEDVSN